jgi:midasin (ATPase involved in ribosome maturation)
VVSAYNSKEYDQVERNNRINQLYRHSALNKDDYLKLKSDYNYSYEINVNKDWQVTIKNR